MCVLEYAYTCIWSPSGIGWKGNGKRRGIDCRLEEEGGHKDLGWAQLEEFISLHIWNPSTVPPCTMACQSANSGPNIFYCDFQCFEFWFLPRDHIWEPLNSLQSRWMTCGHVGPLDHFFLSCFRTGASSPLLCQSPLPPLVYHIHCASEVCLMANDFLTLLERILFVLLKFD